MCLAKYSDYFKHTDPKHYADKDKFSPSVVHNLTCLSVDDPSVFENFINELETVSPEMAQLYRYEVNCNLAGI